MLKVKVLLVARSDNILRELIKFYIFVCTLNRLSVGFDLCIAYYCDDWFYICFE